MQSYESTPRFRNLSNHLTISNDVTPRHIPSSLYFNDKNQEEHRDPEKECFMCRQANIYMKPIGMQQERQVARRHPPPLSRAQIEELCQKKKLTKSEARKLLQCFFPEIKHVKYFQLHKYHSCCYDPKHLNLCKNHITALQRERELHGAHHPHDHHTDETHYKDFERDGGSHNRVSFVRIKIEPTKGIPTRFIGPAALPESLANMLIKQVNRFENKKKPASFGTAPTNPGQATSFKALDQPYANGVARLSEYLSRLDSEDDEDEADEDENDEESNHFSSRSSRIRGFEGKVMDGSRLQYERESQMREVKNKSHPSRVQGDLVVEDLEELNRLFVDNREKKKAQTATELAKRKRARRVGNKKRSRTHRKPRLNHWEQMALDQSKQEVCGCRHHVKRLEADQVIYDWCRCKDHQHRDLKVKQKPPPPPPEIPKPPKAEKKSIGLDAMPPATTEVALSYDATDIDYDVIQEVLYYRTSSGRLIKPEISSSFPMSTPRTTKFNHIKNLSARKVDPYFTTIPEHSESFEESSVRLKTKTSQSPMPGSLTLLRSNTTHFGQGSNGTAGNMPMYQLSSSIGDMALGENRHGQGAEDTKKEDEHEEEDNDDDDDDEDDDETDDDGIEDFTPPKYIVDEKPKTPVVSPPPPTPLAMRKSSKPIYTDSRPTPNYERESIILANRRWFDQPLGDQNLLPVQDGRYGLIAGTTAEKFEFNNNLPDNDYTEPYVSKHKSSCTIS